MGIFTDIFNRIGSNRKVNSSNNLTTALQSFLGNSSGLNEEDIMKIPSAQSATELITSSVGQLPIRLYSLDHERMPVEQHHDNRLFILNNEANEVLNGYSFKKKMAKDYLLYGASKSKIKYAGPTSNHVEGIYPLDSENIIVEVYTSNGVDRYGRVTLNNSTGSYKFDDDELLSVLRDTDNGITGLGILDKNADIFHLALNQMNYESNLLKNNATPNGVIEFDGKVTDSLMKQIRNAWDGNYGGTQNAGKTAIIPDGGQYKPISTSPDKLQLDNSKKNTLSDIARIFNLPESLINASANKYNSNEQDSMYFVRNCLGPILVSIETALNKALLSYSEKRNGYYFKFDTSSIINSTLQDKAQASSTLYNNGIISLKEARKRVDYNNIIGQDFIKFSQGNVLYNTKSGNMSILNKGENINEDDVSSISGKTDDDSANKDDLKEGND